MANTEEDSEAEFVDKEEEVVGTRPWGAQDSWLPGWATVHQTLKTVLLVFK